MQIVKRRNGVGDPVPVAEVHTVCPYDTQKESAAPYVNLTLCLKNATAVNRMVKRLLDRGMHTRDLYCKTEQGYIHWRNYVNGQRRVYRYS